MLIKWILGPSDDLCMICWLESRTIIEIVVYMLDAIKACDGGWCDENYMCLMILWLLYLRMLYFSKKVFPKLITH